MKWCVRSVFITLGLVLPSLILDSNRETNKAWAGDFDVLELVQQTQPSDRFLPPESEPIQPLPEERKPVITPTETQPSPPLETPDLTISVRQIEVVGSTIFTPKDWNPIIEPLAGRTVTLAQLQEAADKITQLYVENGYITSRAVLGEQEIVDGVVQIQVIEGRLSEIKIEGAPRLDNYVRSRLELGAKTPLRPNRIEDQLLLLQSDPLIKGINASLQPGVKIGESILVVTVNPAPSFNAELTADNYSPPILGGEQYGIGVGYGNLTGLGDRIFASYKHTSGRTNLWDFRYHIPLNPMDGAVELRAFLSRSEFTSSQTFNLINQGQITQETFDLTLSSDYDFYQASFRQPIIRTPRKELALSLGFSYRNGFPLEALEAVNLPAILTDFLNQVGVEQGLQDLGLLSPDLNQDKTSVFALGVDYITRDQSGVWALRSQFNFGTGLFDATIRPSPLPDGLFFSWLLQMQRIHRLGEDNLLLISVDIQLTPNSLLASEQFVIGGGQSLRGYRQNVRFGDNGFRFSIEDRIALVKNEVGNAVFQIAPFADIGQVWNNPDNPVTLPSQTFLAAIGVGLLWNPVKQVAVRLDFALPFVNLKDRGNNIQDNGIYFNVIIRP